jgi:hypothetical protein
MSLFEDDMTPGRPLEFELATSRAKKRAGKSGGSRGAPSTTGFSFTVTTSAGQESGEEDKLDFDWNVVREWARAELDSTSQARMLFESEKKDQMGLDEAVPKFIMIKRLLEDELKRRAMR